MVSFPNCKINLGLNIVSKRPDGFHNLETVFYPIPLKDVLEVIQAQDINFTTTGLAIAGNEEDNLCIKAYKLLKTDFPHIPNVHIHLHKAIPMGAGLGGGSADGAFMLLALNKKFHLNLTEEQLIDYALALGSDCPFFIINKPSLGAGRGEVLTPVNLDLSAYQFALVNPQIHISTKEAFSKLAPAPPSVHINEIIQQPIETWKNDLKNDFEEFIFQLSPAIKAIKDEMYATGAIYCSMTGTGSTVYGIFPATVPLKFSFPENYISVILPNT